jgi:hypothetical protein
MVDEPTPEEKQQQVTCEILFTDLESAIDTAHHAGIGRDEIKTIFMQALDSAWANAKTPEESEKWRADIRREAAEWQKAHPEVGPPPE